MEKICFYIVVPVYQAEKVLGDAVQSVLNQPYEHFRLILVDDALPDASGRLCDELKAKDSRIRVIHQAGNTGPFCARRAGIQCALQEGKPNDYLMFLDADDVYRPNTLETVHRIIEQEKSDLVIFGMDCLMNGKPAPGYETGLEISGPMTDRRELYKTVFNNECYNNIWRKAAKLSLFAGPEPLEWYDIRLGEDLLQSLCLLKNCERAYFCPEVLYTYNVVPTSITNSLTYEKYRVDSTVRATVWQFLQDEGLWTEEDFSEYLAYCRRLVREEIFTIAKFETSFANRYRLLEDMRKDSYYKMVLDSAENGDFFLKNTVNGNFRPLCVMGTAAKKLGNLRKWVRKVKIVS